MAVKTYCTYGLYDEDSANSLEEGECCERFTYWDKDIGRVTLENVKINSISKNEVTIELEDYTQIDIKVTDIIDWESN